MGDTYQVVSWSLEQRCKLRPRAGLDEATYASLVAAREYSAWLRERPRGLGVFGDIYVSSYTPCRRPGGRNRNTDPIPRYPENGFLISEQFGECGGPEALLAMCGSCPANIFQHEPAGCFGWLRQEPDSPETEAQLRGIVSRLGVEDQ